MINQINQAGYQSYAYQDAAQGKPSQQEPVSGDNRIQPRQAPAADSQRSDQRESSNQNQQPAALASSDSKRGKNLDTSA